jgi:hypothetical protein
MPRTRGGPAATWDADSGVTEQRRVKTWCLTRNPGKVGF